MTPHADKSAATSGMPLAVVWRHIAALQSDPENPRSHSAQQIRQLAKSIAAFGFNIPVLIDRGLRIIAGHGRLLAVRELGWSEVPTIFLDHLSPAQARAFMIADNRLAETASWDDLLLAMQLKELSLAEIDFGIEATGYEPKEIDLRVAALDHSRQPRHPRRASPRRRTDPPRAAVPVPRNGDVWLLGRHRLHCAAATDAVAEMLTQQDSVIVVIAPGPAAADAVIRRWQAATGGTARHMASGRVYDDPAADVPENPAGG